MVCWFFYKYPEREQRRADSSFHVLSRRRPAALLKHISPCWSAYMLRIVSSISSLLCDLKEEAISHTLLKKAVNSNIWHVCGLFGVKCLYITRHDERFFFWEIHNKLQNPKCTLSGSGHWNVANVLSAHGAWTKKNCGLFIEFATTKCDWLVKENTRGDIRANGRVRERENGGKTQAHRVKHRHTVEKLATTCACKKREEKIN